MPGLLKPALVQPVATFAPSFATPASALWAIILVATAVGLDLRRASVRPSISLYIFFSFISIVLFRIYLYSHYTLSTLLCAPRRSPGDHTQCNLRDFFSVFCRRSLPIALRRSQRSQWLYLQCWLRWSCDCQHIFAFLFVDLRRCGMPGQQHWD